MVWVLATCGILLSLNGGSLSVRMDFKWNKHNKYRCRVEIRSDRDVLKRRNQS